MVRMMWVRMLCVAVALLTVTVALPGVAAGGSWPGDSLPALAENELGLECSERDSVATDDVPSFTYVRCDGEIPSFDGVPLDVTFTLPADAQGPVPAILLLAGWPPGKFNMEDTPCGAKVHCNPHWSVPYHWNNIWFASRGYATITHAARGFFNSCGLADPDPACAKGHTQLASRDAETRDAQYLLGLAVEAGIAHPDRLAATGGSYGGGQAWLLATSMPWKSPRNNTTLQLAAAAPYIGWTDLHSSLLPNGRASDSREQTAALGQPQGIVKESYLTLFHATGRSLGQARYNTTDPEDHGSFFDGAFAFWQAGEPYEPDTARAYAAAWERKSAYYAHDYLAALAGGKVRPVPIMAVSGWTDPLFPAVESVQMYRKLKVAAPGYPIWMTFADVGHGVPDRGVAADRQWQALNNRANEFLDAFLSGGDDERPADRVVSLPAECSPTVKEAVVAPSWDHLARSTVVFGDDTPQQTTWAGSSPLEELVTEPESGGRIGRRCDVAEPAEGAARWSWKVDTGDQDGFTLIGLPRLTLTYKLTGVNASVVAKLWHVDHDGKRQLVTRGAYRLSAADGDEPAGTLSFQLFGNHWQFPHGHTIELEVSQTDMGFLRPNNLRSTLDFSRVEITLPRLEKRKQQ